MNGYCEQHRKAQQEITDALLYVCVDMFVSVCVRERVGQRKTQRQRGSDRKIKG